MRVAGVSIDLLEVPLRATLATAAAGWAVVRTGSCLCARTQG